MTFCIRIGTLCSMAALFWLTGCSASFDISPSDLPTQMPLGVVKGTLHGGQQAISSARVYLFSAGTAGYGGSGLAASTANASNSLLNDVAGATSADGNLGYYATTGSDGSFSISGDYTCTSGDQVYLYGVGGDAGGGVNSAVGLLAVLGQCPISGSLASTVPFLNVNEVTTVAAAYALAGFATDATHVSSSGTALAKTGIANAFANAANLVSVSTGAALAQTPAGNGLTPQAKINTLADILASCINSTGPASTSCTTLFTNAQAAGASGGKPSDTATAAINIAHYPGNAVSALFGLTGGIGAPFQTPLSAAPNDWTLSIAYTGAGLADTTQGSSDNLAIDASGNVFALSNGAGILTKFSPQGVLLSPASGYPAAAVGISYQFALDSFNNVWIPTYANFSAVAAGVVKLDNSGNLLSPTNGFTTGGIHIPYFVAFDASDRAWILNSPAFNYSTNQSVPATLSELTNAGAAVITTPYTLPGTAGIEGLNNLAIGTNGTLWLPGVETNQVTGVDSSGNALPNSPFTGGGLSRQPYQAAIDATGNVWVSDQTYNQGYGITKLSSSGAAISPSTGYTGGGLSAPQGIALDGAGNVWICDLSSVSYATTPPTYYPTQLSAFSNSGLALTPSSGYQLTSNGLRHLAIDGSGNVWTLGGTTNIFAQGNGNYGISIVETLTQMIGAAAPVVTPIAAGVKLGVFSSRP